MENRVTAGSRLGGTSSHRRCSIDMAQRPGWLTFPAAIASGSASSVMGTRVAVGIHSRTAAVLARTGQKGPGDGA